MAETPNPVNVEDKLTPELRRALVYFSRGLEPLWRIEEVFVSSALDQNFRVGGRPTKWRAPSSITMAGRQSGRGLALQDRGDLRLAVTTPGRGTAGSIRMIRGKTLTWGTNLPWAAVHNPPEGVNETTIRPRKARMLAIPLNRAAKREASPRQAWSKHGLVTIRTKEGRLFGAKPVRSTKAGGGRMRGAVEGQAFEFWYMLVPFVVIAARRFMYIPDRDVTLMAEAARNWFASKIGGGR